LAVFAAIYIIEKRLSIPYKYSANKRRRMLRSIPRRYYIDVHITIGLEVLCVTVQHIRVVDEEEEISSLRVV